MRNNKFCRTCFGLVADSNFVPLDGRTPISQHLSKKLTMCVPHVTIPRIANPIMCTRCIEKLDMTYKFREQCLQIEKKINKHLKTHGSTTVPEIADLILRPGEAQCDFLLPEVWDQNCATNATITLTSLDNRTDKCGAKDLLLSREYSFPDGMLMTVENKVSLPSGVPNFKNFLVNHRSDDQLLIEEETADRWCDFQVPGMNDLLVTTDGAADSWLSSCATGNNKREFAGLCGTNIHSDQHEVSNVVPTKGFEASCASKINSHKPILTLKGDTTVKIKNNRCVVANVKEDHGIAGEIEARATITGNKFEEIVDLQGDTTTTTAEEFGATVKGIAKNSPQILLVQDDMNTKLKNNRFCVAMVKATTSKPAEFRVIRKISGKNFVKIPVVKGNIEAKQKNNQYVFSKIVQGSTSPAAEFGPCPQNFYKKLMKIPVQQINNHTVFSIAGTSTDAEFETSHKNYRKTFVKIPIVQSNITTTKLKNHQSEVASTSTAVELSSAPKLVDKKFVNRCDLKPTAWDIQIGVHNQCVHALVNKMTEGVEESIQKLDNGEIFIKWAFPAELKSISCIQKPNFSGTDNLRNIFVDQRKNGKMCQVCRKQFTSYVHLVRHVNLLVRKVPYKCCRCLYEQAEGKSYLEHLEKCKEQNRVCKLCNRKFAGLWALNRHQEVHKDGLTCAVCKHISANWEAKALHVRTHRVRNKRYNCTICPYKGPHPSHLKRHMLTHARERSKPRGFTANQNFVYDKKRETPIGMKIDGSQHFACTQCDFKSSYRSSLYSHNKRHAEKKPFKCTYCDFSAIYKSLLRTHMKRKHMKSHSAKKSTACSECNKRFARNYQLVEHKQLCDSHRIMHRCTFCNYASFNIRKFMQHVTAHPKKQETGDKHGMQTRGSLATKKVPSKLPNILFRKK